MDEPEERVSKTNNQCSRGSPFSTLVGYQVMATNQRKVTMNSQTCPYVPKVD